MTKTTLPLLVLLLAFATAPAGADDLEVRTVEQTVYPGSATKLHLNVGFGQVQVTGSDGRDVEIEAIFTCGRDDLETCRRRAERIVIRPRVRGEVLRVGLKKTPRGRLGGIKTHLRLKVPRDLALEVDVSSGGVYVGGMRSHVEIDSGVGDVDLVHERDLAASVKARIGVGRGDLWLSEGRIEASGVPRSLSWVGAGSAVISVVSGTGDVAIRLE